MTEVFQARPATAPTSQPAGYALKLVTRECRDVEAAVELLQREGRVARQAASSHVVPVLSANFHQTPQFVVMPMLPGASMEQVLQFGSRPLLPVALWIGRQVAEALDALERAGWIHGDVKPGNMIIAPSGHVTLIDLGFARSFEEIDHDRPGEVALQGTLAYLAPELLTSRLRKDIRSDLYSLGVVLYQMLAGRLPFSAEQPQDLAEQHLAEKPQDLRILVPQLPTRVARFVHTMLSKDPMRRPHTAAEVVARLASLEIESFGARAA